MAEVNWKNIHAFIEGNYRLAKDRLGKDIFKVASHVREQVAYRATLCYESCYKVGYHNTANGKTIPGHCKQCGCELPGRWYSTISCNSKKFPDIMGKEEWTAFKEENNIEIDITILEKILYADV